MSSFSKSRLKLSREAIQAKDWQGALEAAEEVLEYEAENYNALVFKALALLNLGKRQESETLYRKATELQPSQPLAWQGLEKLYTEAKEWAKLSELLQRQMDLSAEAGQAVKCAECMQRLVAVQRENGSRSEIASTLSLYLPSSAYHATLASLPFPDQTSPEATTTFDAQMAVHVDSFKVLSEIITLTEVVERDTVEREIDKRKNRLDSMSKSKGALRNEIGLEVWGSSKLPELYEQVLAHVDAPDEARREAEHKLLTYRLNILKALPNPSAKLLGPSGTSATATDSVQRDEAAQRRKVEALKGVEEQASGIVSIDVPDELAWTVVLEWHDVLDLAKLDRQKLRAFMYHFPGAGLSLSIEALLTTVKDGQFLKEQEAIQKEHDNDVRRPDPLTLALDGLEQAQHSLLAHRIVTSLYLVDRDWSSCSEVATAGLSLARRMETELGITLGNAKAGLEAVLAASLTFLHAPQHHTKALRFCDSVLSRDSGNIEALMAKANILQSSGRWNDARNVYDVVQEVDSQASQQPYYADSRALSVYNKPGREARLEVAWCDTHLDRLGDAESEFRQVIDNLANDRQTHPSDEARAWWRLGRCLWQMGGERRTERSQAFSCFITALKKDPAFAPAFTSLGFYYANVATPADPQRASKCFQKAFELDGREDEAAQQLAQMYAEEDDWNLVELVARRTIEAEGGAWVLQTSNPSQRRHKTQNAWAWNAIGSTELVKGNFEEAITALQVALRSFPNSHNIWMRLGDAYFASGRHSAAIKTFEKARSLQTEEEEWQAMFSIASVQRQLGMFEEALTTFEQVSKRKPDLLQIRATCAETRLCLALQEARGQYEKRARKGILLAILEAKMVIEREAGTQAAWKVIADAMLSLSRLERDPSDERFINKVVLPLIVLAKELSVDEGLSSVSAVTSDTVAEAMSNLDESLHGATLALRLAAAYIFKLRVLLLVPDQELVGSAWMDLSVALQSVFEVKIDDGKKSTCKEIQGQAIACAKEALKLEPGNGLYWCTLGNLVFPYGVPLAQHCYIKAIECDAKDVLPWTNLGFLYLANDDVELANECFVRAQTIDPEHVHGWVGQAFVAQQRGNSLACQSMFRHAYTIDQACVLEAAYGFAATTFSQVQASHSPSAALLRLASSALSAYLAQKPYDISALHLSALFCERLAEIDVATERIDLAASMLEKQYEEEESSDKAQLFAVCMANLGRIHLASSQFERAIEVLEMCLGLLEGSEGQEDRGAAISAEDVGRARLGAHCGIGLAHYGLGDTDAAVNAVRQALEDAESIGLQNTQLESAKETLSVMLAQIYWSDGTREAAEAALLDHLADTPHAMEVIATLGAASWLMDNAEQLEAVQSDLHLALEADDVQDGIKDVRDLGARKAVQFLIMRDLYDGRSDAAIGRLRRRAATSLDAHSRLVETLLRIAAMNTQSNEQRWVRAATLEAQRFYDAVKSSTEVRQSMLVDAQRMMSLAAMMNQCATPQGLDSADPPVDGNDVHLTSPVRPARAMALHAFRSAPNSLANLRLLQRAIELQGIIQV